MNSTGDPITPPRVRFLEGQALRAADLTDEQGHRVAMWRRHLRAHHDWGVVRGLSVTLDGAGATAGDLVISPGVAVDGFGRELTVPDGLRIGSGVISKNLDPSRPVDVWLVYRRLPADLSGKILSGGGDATPPRGLERAVVRVLNAPDDGPTPCDPVFVPGTEPPDDPAAEWPVFLGRVHAAPGTKLPDRRPAALYGERVVDASGDARMRVGVSGDGAHTGFAVGLDVPKPADPKSPPRPPQFESIETLILEPPGADGVGRATVTRGLSIGPAARPEGLQTEAIQRVADTSPPDPIAGLARLSFLGQVTPDPSAKEPTTVAAGLAFSQLKAPPDGNVFWRVYRVLTPNDDKTLPALDQLRIEILNPEGKGDPTRNRFVIQTVADPKGVRRPLLTVAADGTVTVGDPVSRLGNMHVGGQVLEGPITADPNDPRFFARLQEGILQGLASASTGLALATDTGQTKLTADPSDPHRFLLKLVLTVQNLLQVAYAPVTVNGNVIDSDGVNHPVMFSAKTLTAGASVSLTATDAVSVKEDQSVTVSLVALGVSTDAKEFQGRLSAPFAIPKRT